MKRDSRNEFEAIHAAGVERHPKSWLHANERAVVTLIDAEIRRQAHDIRKATTG